MSKTLGQIAYEARWHWDNAPGAEESWHTETENHRQAWQAAAEAVVQEASAEWGFQVAKRYEGVIEAAQRAKRTLKECTRVTAGGSDEEIDSLLNAIEALDKAERK